MNQRERELIEENLKSEELILQDIKELYEEALVGIDEKLKILMAEKLTQSKIYQIEYQQALHDQISEILENMNTQQYTKVSDYLKNCYEDGFIGTMYNLQGQDIPLIIPIDQWQVVEALQKDTKLSVSLYEKLGQNMRVLKSTINSEISRGIASGSSYAEIARNITLSTGSIGINRTMTIVRTEGHRINQEASHHAQIKAKDCGADIVKQWDSTLDKRTRKTHSMLDGQIREVDEPFEVNGHQAMYPGEFGVAKEDINCRCVVLQRAKWGITEKKFKKMNGESGKLVKMREQDYQSFKKKYKEEIQKDLFKMNLQRFAAVDHNVPKFLEQLRNGEINSKQRWSKQNEHIEGTAQRTKRIENDLRNEKTPSSYFLKGTNVDEIFKKYSGTGKLIFENGKQYPTEYIDIDKARGKVYNSGIKEYVDTKRIKIEYSTNGYHIYPVKERK